MIKLIVVSILSIGITLAVMSTHNKTDLFSKIERKAQPKQSKLARSKSYLSYSRVGIAPIVDIDLVPTRRIRLVGMYAEGYDDSGAPVVPIPVASRFVQVNPASDFNATSITVTPVIGAPLPEIVAMFGTSSPMFPMDLILEVGCTYKFESSSFIAGSGRVNALLVLEELDED